MTKKDLLTLLKQDFHADVDWCGVIRLIEYYHFGPPEEGNFSGLLNPHRGCKAYPNCSKEPTGCKHK